MMMKNEAWKLRGQTFMSLLSPEEYETTIRDLVSILDDTNMDYTERLEATEKAISKLAATTPVCKNRWGEGYLEVGYLNSRGEIFFNTPKKNINEIDTDKVKDYTNGFLVLLDHEDGLTYNAKTVYPKNDSGELLVDYNVPPYSNFSPKSIGYYQEGKVVYWEQYEE